MTQQRPDPRHEVPRMESWRPDDVPVGQLRAIKITAAIHSLAVGVACILIFDSFIVAALAGAPIVLLISWIATRRRVRIMKPVIERAAMRYIQERKAED